MWRLSLCVCVVYTVSAFGSVPVSPSAVSPSAVSPSAATRQAPASIAPLGEDFTGPWGFSLLSKEEQSREPSSNRLFEEGEECTKDSPLVGRMEEAAKKFEAMYDFEGTLNPMGQHIRPEWEKCMGAAKSAEDWKTNYQDFCLGPLQHLIGTWIGDRGKSYSPVPVYNLGTEEEVTFLEQGVGLIPGQPQGTFHAIKNQTYKEIIQFMPILGNVKNRGYARADHANPNCQADQVNQGLKYILTVVQTSPSDGDGEFGGILHDETGMIMYNSMPASGGGELQDQKVFRMGNIPHGVSFVAEGSHAQEVSGAGAKDKMIAEQEATDMSIKVAPQACVPPDDYDTTLQDWGSQMNGEPQPGVFPFDDLTPFLVNETKKLQEVKSYTHLVMATAELSNTQFLKNQAETVDFKFDMWLSSVVGEDGKTYEQLQYSQMSKFIFQQRFDCLVCEGGTKDANGCYSTCDALEDQIFTNPSGSPVFAEFEGKSLNDIPAVQHGQCLKCEADPACKEQRGGGKMFWPHVQVNTLRKVTDETPMDVLELYRGLDVMTSSTFGS